MAGAEAPAVLSTASKLKAGGSRAPHPTLLRTL